MFSFLLSIWKDPKPYLSLVLISSFCFSNYILIYCSFLQFRTYLSFHFFLTLKIEWKKSRHAVSWGFTFMSVPVFKLHGSSQVWLCGSFVMGSFKNIPCFIWVILVLIKFSFNFPSKSEMQFYWNFISSLLEINCNRNRSHINKCKWMLSCYSTAKCSYWKKML